jgi:hypothetical protein
MPLDHGQNTLYDEDVADTVLNRLPRGRGRD